MNGRDFIIFLISVSWRILKFSKKAPDRRSSFTIPFAPRNLRKPASTTAVSTFKPLTGFNQRNFKVV